MNLKLEALHAVQQWMSSNTEAHTILFNTCTCEPGFCMEVQNMDLMVEF